METDIEQAPKTNMTTKFIIKEERQSLKFACPLIKSKRQWMCPPTKAKIQWMRLQPNLKDNRCVFQPNMKYDGIDPSQIQSISLPYEGSIRETSPPIMW